MACPERKTQSKWQAAPFIKTGPLLSVALAPNPAGARSPQITFSLPWPLNYRFDDTFLRKFDIERFIMSGARQLSRSPELRSTDTKTKTTNKIKETINS